MFIQIIINGIDIKSDNPLNKPSMPSVKLKAFVDEVKTKSINKPKDHFKSIVKLNNDMVVSKFKDKYMKKDPAAIITCNNNFNEGGIPLLLCLIIINKSSTRPNNPYIKIVRTIFSVFLS